MDRGGGSSGVIDGRVRVLAAAGAGGKREPSVRDQPAAGRAVRRRQRDFTGRQAGGADGRRRRGGLYLDASSERAVIAKSTGHGGRPRILLVARKQVVGVHRWRRLRTKQSEADRPR